MASIMTPIGFLYFPTFFTARGNKADPSKAPRFSGMLLFDDTGVNSSAYAALKKGVYDALVEKFGQARADNADFVRTLRLPFRPAGEKSYTGFSDGTTFISAWSAEDQQPGVVDLNQQRIMVPADVYGGQLARFTVRPFAYDTSGNKGASFGLEHVQIVKSDMPRRDGQVEADKAFAAADDSQLAALGITTPAPGSAPGDLPF